MGVLKPDLIMKSVIPVVMAGILGIYGMIVAVILLGRGINKSINLSIQFLAQQMKSKAMLSLQVVFAAD